MSTWEENNASMQDPYLSSILDMKNHLILETRHLTEDQSPQIMVLYGANTPDFLNFGNPIALMLVRSSSSVYLLY